MDPNFDLFPNNQSQNLYDLIGAGQPQMHPAINTQNDSGQAPQLTQTIYNSTQEGRRLQQS